VRTRNIGQPQPPSDSPQIPPRPRQPTIQEILEAERILALLAEAGRPNDGEVELGDGGFDGENLMMRTGPAQIRPVGALAYAGFHPNGAPMPPTAHTASFRDTEQVCIDCGQPAGSLCVMCHTWHCNDCAPTGLRDQCKKCGQATVWPYGEAPKGTFSGAGRRNY